MKRLRKFMPVPAVKKPCPHCTRSISSSGFAWTSHKRKHEREAAREAQNPRLPFPAQGPTI